MASTSVAVVAVVLSAGRVWPRACQLQRLLQLGNMQCMARDGRPEVGMYMSSKRAVWVFSIECCMADVLCVMYRLLRAFGWGGLSWYGPPVPFVTRTEISREQQIPGVHLTLERKLRTPYHA
jgi:hypothetical protein